MALQPLFSLCWETKADSVSSLRASLSKVFKTKGKVGQNQYK